MDYSVAEADSHRLPTDIFERHKAGVEEGGHELHSAKIMSTVNSKRRSSLSVPPQHYIIITFM